jgi:endonuclease G
MTSDAFEISIDRNYQNREGYASRFLGIDVPLPKLSNAVRAKAVRLANSGGDTVYELKYHHFSVIMNSDARLAFVAAVNYDGAAGFRQTRQGSDRWFLDPRIDAALQAGDEFYADNPLDRGHLVRRADAGWGQTADEARRASDDTFHFTNCSPQHEIFNQAAKARKEDLLLWGNLEDHIAAHCTGERRRVSVFNGPVFRSSDRTHRGLRIPKEFWKIVVYVTRNDNLAALAFILSQEGLIANLPLEDFPIGPYRPFQIKVREIEARTKLDFDVLRGVDPLENQALESIFMPNSDAILLNSLDDVVTPEI